MGIVRGLNALNQQMEKQDFSEEGQKGTWLKINDGQSLKIRFMQEIDPNSENYNEKAGSAFIAVEHSNPADYKRKALCSIEDQGRCFGCEMHRRDPKAKWGRISLPKAWAFLAPWVALRCMTFFAWEWPAIAVTLVHVRGKEPARLISGHRKGAKRARR